MIQFIVWSFLIYGFSNILVYGKIFNTPRDYIKLQSEKESFLQGFYIFLRDMLSCMMCAPVWLGFFFGIFLFSPISNFLEVHPLVSWFFDGILASGTTWMINSVIEWFEENRPKN